MAGSALNLGPRDVVTSGSVRAAMSSRLTSVVLLTTLLSGCTSWGSKTIYGSPREVGRRMVGSPGIAETSSSSLSAGFAGSRGGGSAVAGLSGSTGSIKRTHCVQQAEIDYEQPYDVHPTVKGRALDVAGGITLMVLGLSGIASSGPADSFYAPGDPYYEEPQRNNGALIVGSAMLIGGIALLGYSFKSLPKAPAPAVVSSSKRWTDSKLVEATGCGLPGDPTLGGPPPVALPPVVTPPPPPPTPAATDDTAKRLQKLDNLRRQGVINEAEYQRKRKEILDGI